ncbi:hypothetical protein SH139x_001603 [Planctomycetaceae bacterium SH139]
MQLSRQDRHQARNHINSISLALQVIRQQGEAGDTVDLRLLEMAAEELLRLEQLIENPEAKPTDV